jgi:hypothetical protein
MTSQREILNEMRREEQREHPELYRVRRLANRRGWRIAPRRDGVPRGKYVLFRGGEASNLPAMTLAEIERWLLLPARVRRRAKWDKRGRFTIMTEGQHEARHADVARRIEAGELRMNADGVVVPS